MIVHKFQESEDFFPGHELESLYSWAKSVNIVINPKLAYPVRFSPGYLGTKALNQLNSEEVLIEVPNSAILSSNMSTCEELLEVFASHPEIFSIPNREHEDYRMVAYLLLELSKGPDSFWHFYLASLPNDPETVTEWKEKELLELQDSDFVNDAIIRKEWNSGLFKTLLSVLSKFPQIFKSEYLNVHKIQWVFLIMTTRYFGGGLPAPSLIPVADFFNHSNGPTNYYYGSDEDPAPDSFPHSESDEDDQLIDESDIIQVSCEQIVKINFLDSDSNTDILREKINDKAKEIDAEENEKKNKKLEKKQTENKSEDSDQKKFRIRVSKYEKYEAGSQVTICYGKYSNRMLLTCYGFAMKNNKYNYARCKFPLKSLLKQSQLERINEIFENPLCVAFKFKTNYLNMSFLRFLRGILWESDMPVEAFFKPCLLRHEKKVLDFGENLLVSQVEEFETSIEEDSEIIKCPKSHRHYFAVLNN